MSDDYEDQYTQPNLRRKLKKKIMAGKKGGRRGTWSARKAQILVKKYEAKGGDYKADKSDAQKSLENWTAQDWQTVDGSGQADSNGDMRRYLPAKVWDMLSNKQQERAEETKIQKDRRGRQFADWPGCVYSAMTAAGLTSDPPEKVRKKRLKEFASRLGYEVDGSETKSDFVRYIKNANGEDSRKSTGGTAASSQNKKTGPAKSKNDLETKTKDELYEMAKDQDVPGRSAMNKADLISALS